MGRPPPEALLGHAFRTASGRVIAALAARLRDLDLAEEAFAEACARAAARWSDAAVPDDPAAWLYRTAERAALDMIRRAATRARVQPEPPPEPTIEEMMASDAALIPDERLRLIFVCCHPAIAPDSRAALTLRLVCGLSTAEVAAAFLLTEPTLAQRLTRAKRKVAEAGIPFEVPGPQQWAERLEAVLSTIEVAYAKAHEDAAGAGRHAGFAAEMLELTDLLARLLPNEPEVHALAATIHFAEARRPARVTAAGEMIPLSEQNPADWRHDLIAAAGRHMEAAAKGPPRPRIVQAAIHQAWCRRRSLDNPPPWPEILALYDRLLSLRDDVVVRINRLVALAEVDGAGVALAELQQLPSDRLGNFLPYHAVRADLLRKEGRIGEARQSYDAALALDPAPAEARWLARRRDERG
ncbi:MAG TPA: sigma-70 family RNA polymerase sigma factor [Allosphingosinicella sp.]|nr:sigma-70 family RNA polymerase sigma factor [Allosphingosinicella sp.]